MVEWASYDLNFIKTVQFNLNITYKLKCPYKIKRISVN